MRYLKVAAIFALVAVDFSSVVAQENNLASPNEPAINSAKSETKPTTSSDKTVAKETAEKSEQRKPKTALSLSAYKALIAKKIALRANSKNTAGPGEVQATFRVNDEGRIDQISIKKASNPKLADHVKNILTGVVAPPPPEGPIFLGQPFRFN